MKIVILRIHQVPRALSYGVWHFASRKRLLVGFVGVAIILWLRDAPKARGQFADVMTYIVKIREGTTDISRHGESEHHCILIFPDGHFHMERRDQRLPAVKATLKIFDYSLDSLQLQQLQAILDEENIRRLPSYAQPMLPMGAPWSHGFEVSISRGARLQHVGYWTWHGGSPTESPNSSPESARIAWQESEAALQPLVAWLHGIEALRLSPSDAKTTLCTTDQD
jgi:hypothetical protein